MAFRSVLRTALPQNINRSFTTSATQNDVARMQLLGRLVADPEQRTTRTGKDYVKYTVATTDPLGPPNESGERGEPTSSYHSIFAFGEGPVSRLTKLTKGTQVLVDADFKVQYEPSEAGGQGQTNYLVQHRSLTVVSRPKPAEV